jgi:hypothetical protein
MKIYSEFVNLQMSLSNGMLLFTDVYLQITIQYNGIKKAAPAILVSYSIKGCVSLHLWFCISGKNHNYRGHAVMLSTGNFKWDSKDMPNLVI